MDIYVKIISYVTNITLIIKTMILHAINYVTTLLDKKESISKVKWCDDLQDVYYTYSKYEYDRTPFKPFLFQRNFFK